jgi:hypothetical protein
MDFHGGRRLDPAEAGGIDVPLVETGSAMESGSARAFLISIVLEASEGRRGEA